MWNDPAAGLDSVITRRMPIHISDFCLDHVSFWFSLWSVWYFASLSLIYPFPPPKSQVCSCLHAYAQIPLQLIMSPNMNYVNYAMLWWSKLVPVYFVVSTNERKEKKYQYNCTWPNYRQTQQTRSTNDAITFRQLQVLLCTFYWNFQDSKQVNASRKPLIRTTCVSAPPQCTNTSQYLYSGVHTMKKDLVDCGPEALMYNVMMMDHWKEMPGLAVTANTTLVVYTEYLNWCVPVSIFFWANSLHLRSPLSPSTIYTHTDIYEYSLRCVCPFASNRSHLT